MTAFECLAFEALGFETNCDEQEEEEAADLSFGSGGGGGLIWKPLKKYGAQTIIKTPRLYSAKVELPQPRRETDPAKLLKTELPLNEEQNREQRWLAFREQTNASYPEFICFEWLTTKKKLKSGLDFYFQYPFLGGRTQYGGFVLDFFFPFRRMAWFVQGLHFHYTSAKDRGRDKLSVAQVASRGVVVVELWEDDLIQRTEYALERAWRGEQIRRAMT